ncbi:4811_t:CDS:1, partial [Racocetra persica]
AKEEKRLKELEDEVEKLKKELSSVERQSYIYIGEKQAMAREISQLKNEIKQLTSGPMLPNTTNT